MVGLNVSTLDTQVPWPCTLLNENSQSSWVYLKTTGHHTPLPDSLEWAV